MNFPGRNVVILATLCWFWPGIAVLAADGETRELLPNPGFEEGTYKLPPGHVRVGLEVPNGWFMDWNSWGDAAVVKGKETAHSGEQCLRLQYRLEHNVAGRLKGREQVIMTARGVKIKPGEKYLVRIWVKGGDIGKEFGVSFYEYGEKPKRGYLGYTNVKASLPLKLGAQWRLYHGIYEPKSKDVDTATFVFGSSPGNTNALWVDDASLRVLDTRPLPERIKETGMEKDKERYIKLFQAMPKQKEKFSRQLERLYGELDNLKEAAAADDVSLPEQYEQEWELDRLQEEYQEFRYAIAFDGIKM